MSSVVCGHKHVSYLKNAHNVHLNLLDHIVLLLHRLVDFTVLHRNSETNDCCCYSTEEPCVENDHISSCSFLS